jgi:hypothetical protein
MRAGSPIKICAGSIRSNLIMTYKRLRANARIIIAAYASCLHVVKILRAINSLLMPYNVKDYKDSSVSGGDWHMI